MELKERKLVNVETGQLDPLKFQQFITQRRPAIEANDEN
jgi:hypothetical protein